MDVEINIWFHLHLLSVTLKPERNSSVFYWRLWQPSLDGFSCLHTAECTQTHTTVSVISRFHLRNKLASNFWPSNGYFVCQM